MTDALADRAAQDAWLDDLVRQNPDALLAALDEDGVCLPLPATPEWAGRRAVRPAECASILELVLPGEEDSVLRIWDRALATGSGTGVVRSRQDGERSSNLTILDTRHRYGFRVAVLTWLGTSLGPAAQLEPDRPASSSRRKREQLFGRLADALPVGVLQLTREGDVAYVNAEFGRVLSLDVADLPSGWLDRLEPVDRAQLGRALDRVLSGGPDEQLAVTVLLRAGGDRSCRLRLLGLGDQFGSNGVVVIVDDIDDPGRMREQLRNAAVLDQLTGAHDRGSVLAVLDQSLASSRGTATVLVHLLGADQVRAEHGPSVADELLAHTARCVTAPLRGGDVVGRYESDQFLVVCHGVDEPVQALAIAGRIRQALVGTPPGPDAPAPRVNLGVTLVRPGTEREAVLDQVTTATRRSGRLGTGMPVLYRDA
jgi:diguanylate cyclase (GGDEF)-like protein